MSPHNGVQAVLSLKSDIAIPRDLTAAVHSRSAVGEQFLELTPHSGTVQDTGPKLRDGDVIAVGKTQIPVDIGLLLDTTNKALTAIPQDNLHTVVDEAAKAVAGLGPELSRLVDGGTALAIDAGKTTDSFSRLIDEFPPVASSQVRTSDSIATWARRVNAITSQVKAQDDRLADLLNTAGPALDEGTALFDRLAPTLPVLLANLVSLGTITVNYRNDLEQLLVMFPQGTAVMSSIIVPDRVAKMDYKGIYLDFNLNLNSPPPCNAGFLPVQQQRIPVRQDYPDRTNGELYCRIPQNSDMNVRGVRNVPCETKPGKRAPTVEMCESDEQYVPLNDGLFWKGDPNATLSGQGVPQFPKGGPPYSPGEHWHPPVDPAAPKPALRHSLRSLDRELCRARRPSLQRFRPGVHFERQNMAEHAGSAEKTESVAADSPDAAEDLESTADELDAEDPQSKTRKRVPAWVSHSPTPITVGVGRHRGVARRGRLAGIPPAPRRSGAGAAQPLRSGGAPDRDQPDHDQLLRGRRRHQAGPGLRDRRLPRRVPESVATVRRGGQEGAIENRRHHRRGGAAFLRRRPSTGARRNIGQDVDGRCAA